MVLTPYSVSICNFKLLCATTPLFVSLQLASPFCLSGLLWITLIFARIFGAYVTLALFA